MRIPARKSKRSRADDALATTSPIQQHLRKKSRRSDAGGAYLVLPVGLIDQLPAEQQQQLVDVAERLNQLFPAWGTAMTYQVMPWARVRPADLTSDELSWHGITEDMSPQTGEVGHFRAGELLPADYIVGHRPGIEIAPALPGTFPGARPPLLPATPWVTAPGGSSPVARQARASRVALTQQRLQEIRAADPGINPAWADGIAAADEMWTGDQQWRALVNSTATPATAPEIEASRPQPKPAEEVTAPARAEHVTEPTEDISADLTGYQDELDALEKDLEGLFEPE